MEMVRFSAEKVRIAELTAGRFISGDRENFTPNYIVDKLGRKIARVNIVATAMDKFVSGDGRYATITIDDSSGSIRLKFFGDDVKHASALETGNELMVVGKVKKYNEEIYILPEIVKTVEDLNHIALRRLEVLKDILQTRRLVETVKELADTDGLEAAKIYAKENLNVDENALDFILSKDKSVETPDAEVVILKTIESLDEDGGVELERILEESRLSENEVDAAITKLLDDGVIFEPRVGKFKLVG